MRGVRVGLAVLGVAILAGAASAQQFRHAGTQFTTTRPLVVPVGQAPSVVVTEFFHHGQIAPGGKNVAVIGKDKKPVPCRVLQLGPGDFCRLAFQAVSGQASYDIYYGGEPPTEVPEWTTQDGLLLETREFAHCNLNSLEDVRKAFEAAKPIGADYVAGVEHACNPIRPAPGPFLSHYSGWLRVPAGGSFGFFTSSQDASFLLIDDKLVADAPGTHGPAREARPELRKKVNLSEGLHRFDYYHAAAGPSAMMVAAWEIAPVAAKPQPVRIPPEDFAAGKVLRVPPGSPSTDAERMIPDFLIQVAGDVPLPDDDEPMIGALFKDNSAPGLTVKAKAVWDFGDGQSVETSESPLSHVYLRPGLYRVSITLKRSGRDLTTTNQVLISRPFLTPQDKLHTLDDYLPAIQQYAVARLDARSVRQLVLAYETKAMVLESPQEAPAAEPPPEESQSDGSQKPGKTPEQLAAEAAAREAEVLTYLRLAVDAGKTAIADPASAATGDNDLLALARTVVPIARERLGDSELALEICRGAMKKIKANALRAECAIEAANILVNDLLQAEQARPLLDGATAVLKGQTGEQAARLFLTWGDYFAATREGEKGRKAYAEAARLLSATQGYSERIAWQGAHSRSVEEYLNQKQYARAIAEIRVWERAFPLEKLDGYLTLKYMRYWAECRKYDQAVALSEQLMNLNPESPYVDQVLMLAAECELQRGKADRALATLQGLLRDQPGSPLVPAVKQRIAELESGTEDSGQRKKENTRER